VLAHRGASAASPPGNHRTAFAVALDAGIDHLETDVQASADGEIVIFHDDRLDGITTGSGRIADHPWSTIEQFRYVAGNRTTDHALMRLDDAMSNWPEAFWNIDVKTDDAVEATVDILQRHRARERVCVAAFGWRRLRRLRRLLGDGWCTAFSQAEIALVRAATWLRLPVPTPGDVLQVPTSARGITIVDRAFVERCHRRGVAVHVWTVNDPDDARRLRALGVDAVITDRVELAQE
jgi:glycerophosphoryl diester phosphodiesterase